VALRYQPRRPDALLERARIYLRQGKYAEAVEDLTPILNMFPNNGDVRLARAMAYKGLEQYRLAAEDLVQAIRLIQVQPLPGQDPFNLYATLAHCQARCGQAEAAVRTYSRALEVQPRSLLALVERGQAHRELGNYDGALTDFSTAVEHWPTSPEALLERAAAYAALGDNTPAGLDREAARQLDPRLSPAEPAESYWNDVRL
jgi:tetratricopeptide (TPR) repeat protein